MNWYAYRLRVVDNNDGISFDCMRNNMKGKKEEIVIKPYNSKGEELTKKQLDIATGQPIQYTFKYIDKTGNQYDKGEVIFKNDKGEEVESIDMTTVFEVIAYRPINEYTDRFVVDSFYELYPDNGASHTNKGKKKVSDYERDQTRVSNLVGMRKLWEKLYNGALVAGGHFNGASGNFKPGMAFIRAVKMPGEKWVLELGVFKEEKVFEHLQEGIPHAIDRKDNKKMKSNLL